MKVVICESNLKPRLVPVASSKGDGTWYTTVPSTIWNDAICDCKGFEFRGTCRHVDLIEADHCEYVRKWQGEVDSDGDGNVGRCACGEPLVIFELKPEFDEPNSSPVTYPILSHKDAMYVQPMYNRPIPDDAKRRKT